jgi:hypothetical protein
MLDLLRVLIPLIVVSVASGSTAQDDVKAEHTKGQQLVIAAFQLDVDRVTALLASGADPNTRMGKHRRAIFADKWNGGVPMASSKWTPLLAVASSHRAPQPDKPTENTSEAMEAAWKKLQAIDPKLIAEREKRRVAIAKLLIAAKADLDSDDGFGATALYCSVQNRFHELSLLLVESNAELDTTTGIYIDGPGGNTPAHYAVASPKVLAAMLKRGVNINVSSTSGSTPLHWAVKGGHVEAVKLLLAAGADINAKDKRGHLPAYWCTESNEPFAFPVSADQKKIAKLLRAAKKE